jgi:hypothetical protein
MPHPTTTSVKCPSSSTKCLWRRGNRAAFAAAARLVEAEYGWPFQSHACIDPARAGADVWADGAPPVDRLAKAAFRPRRAARATLPSSRRRPRAPAWGRIEGNVVQGTSRTLSEEVAFDRTKVTSVDWLSYPILDITEAPEAVDIVLINHPELPPAGAGESSIRPVAAAIANAVFDTTGVRLRRAPLTSERLKPALA